jgi:hypothetical protein
LVHLRTQSTNLGALSVPQGAKNGFGNQQQPRLFGNSA